MRQLSGPELANEIKIVAQITEKLLLHPPTDLRGEINSLGAFLQACETKLIKLMNNEHPSESEPGVTQYGLVLYIVDTTHPILRHSLDNRRIDVPDNYARNEDPISVPVPRVT